MREILFRGRSIESGEWYCGDLINTQGTIPPYVPIILVPDNNSDGFACHVVPDTVGQYTGLKDKNGVKIFEGDIVDMGDNWWDAYGPAGHDSQKTIVHWSEEHCGFDPFANYDCDCCVYIQSELCTVIGNIHDNPEILDGGAE